MNTGEGRRAPVISLSVAFLAGADGARGRRGDDAVSAPLPLCPCPTLGWAAPGPGT